MNKETFLKILEENIKALSNPERKEVLEFYNEFLDEELTRFGNLDNLEDAEVIGKRLSKDTILEAKRDYPLTISNIKKLNVDITFGNITIRDGEKFDIDHNIRGLMITEHDDVVEIYDVYKKQKQKNHIILEDDDLRLNIVLPYGFKVVKINNQFGDTSISNLVLSSFSLKNAAGNLLVANLNIDETSIDTNAGSIKIVGSMLNDYAIKVNAGSIKIDNTSLRNGTLKVDVGEVKAHLIDANSLNIKSDVSFGSSLINGIKTSQKSVAESNDEYLEADVSLGSIDISV